MSKNYYIKVSKIIFVVCVIFSATIYLFQPILIVALLGMTGETASFLVVWNAVYIASLLSQQKPKQQMSEERHLLKNLLLFAFLAPLFMLLFVAYSMRKPHTVALMLITSLNLFLLIIYPALLIFLRRDYIKNGDKVKESISNKAIVAFILILLLAAVRPLLLIR